jgi:hypothetical protein
MNLDLSNYQDIANLSKYVEEQTKKLTLLHNIKLGKFEKEAKAVIRLMTSLGEMDIGTDLFYPAREIQQKIRVFEQKINIPTGVPTFTVSRLSSTPANQRAEIKSLFQMLSTNLDNVLKLLGEEQDIIAELHKIHDLAQKNNLKHITKHINEVDQALQLNMKTAGKHFTEQLAAFMAKPKIKEESVMFGVGQSGTMYYPEKGNQKAIIIYAGTTIHHRQYEPLSYRFAMEGYTVLAMNLPAHGNDINFRLGNGAEVLANAVRHLQSNFARIGVIAFSFGALATLYNILNFDYKFEELLETELTDFVILLEKGNLAPLKEKYFHLKKLVHQSVLRASQKFSVRGGTGISRGIPDILILGGMPPSLMKSRKLLCPTVLTVSYSWMKLTTNSFLNAPKPLIKKIINGFEEHRPIPEPKYEDKNAAYMKFFKISSEEEFAQLKKYMHDVSKDPKNVLALLAATEDGAYLQYFMKKVKAIPKLFMYGEKDAIASGGFFKEVLSRTFKRNTRNLDATALTTFVESLSHEGSAVLKVYPNLGHTLDERAGFIKKLSRRPQSIKVQNDMVGFMNKML